jgi:uncharacterized protein with FMN-binding domain
MKRAPVVLAATAAGLAATLGFHAHAQTPTATPVATTSTPSSSSSKTSSARKTVTSDAISTRYGNVQLRVTISGGKITDVQAVQLPQQDPKSVQISSSAAPLLRQSALSKQSASVDAVSGATYTSDGYKTALQSALDRAGFQASMSSVASAQ